MTPFEKVLILKTIDVFSQIPENVRADVANICTMAQLDARNKDLESLVQAK